MTLCIELSVPDSLDVMSLLERLVPCQSSISPFALVRAESLSSQGRSHALAEQCL